MQASFLHQWSGVEFFVMYSLLVAGAVASSLILWSLIFLYQGDYSVIVTLLSRRQSHLDCFSIIYDKSSIKMLKTEVTMLLICFAKELGC